MATQASRSSRVSAVLAVLAVLATFAVPAAASADVSSPGSTDDEVPALLSAPTGARSGGDAEIVRPVEVDAAVLVPNAPVTVDIDLFGDARFRVDMDPFDGGAPGWHAWTGPVRDIPDGTATFIRRGNEVSGVVSTPDGTFQVERRGKGNVARRTPGNLSARQTEPDFLIPPEDGRATPPPGGGSESDRGAGGAPATGPVVDVLVAYTPAARAEMGGKVAIENEAALSLAVTNTAYLDSGVNGSLRLVGVMETSSNIAIGEAELDALTDPIDGILDEVPVRRDALGADLVSLLTGRDTYYCGLAWFLDTMSGDAAWGYSQVSVDCAVGDMAVAHELGHNLGLDHDRYVSDAPPVLAYAYGYVDVAAGWRTVMSYNTQCTDAGTSCTRLPRFSNPDQTYDGRPLGRPAGGTKPADNRKALNLTVPLVAGYRTANDVAKLGYASVTPCRVVDTRSAGGVFGSGVTRTFQVAGGGAAFVGQGGRPGGCNVPADATAVEATITAVGPVAGGFARAYPAGTAMPGATFLNYARRQSIGNTGTIPIATTGSTADLTLSNFGGTTHYVIDIQGYFSAVAPLGYASITPCRVVDTRSGGGQLRSGETRTFQVAGGGPVFPSQGGRLGGCSLPADATAVEATITAVGPEAGGFARAHPAGTAMPGATFLNYARRQSIGNTGTIPIATTGSTADLTLSNFGGTTHYVIDIQGYFSAVAPLGYVPIKPCRVVDSRNSVAYVGPGDAPTYQVAGSGVGFSEQGGTRDGCSVPAAARAVEATITSVAPDGDGYARAHPAGTATPGATFLNYVAWQAIGNTGTVPIATTESTDDLTLKNYGAVTDYVIDIQGFYAPR